ncbi:hypothetical protein [Dyella subtropica]|uniref:hypothetical protein n=1 Tax=Dyella subtropica TaxID=2992127 RepID=UPI003CE47ADD
MDAAEVQWRVNAFWKPSHQTLSHEIARLRQAYGRVWGLAQLTYRGDSLAYDDAKATHLQALLAQGLQRRLD